MSRYTTCYANLNAAGELANIIVIIYTILARCASKIVIILRIKPKKKIL